MSDKPDNSILIAGFEPFGVFDVNPSELIAKELDGEVIGDCTIRGIVLPVVFGEAGDILIRVIEEVNPDVVLCLGLAANRTEISVERIAVNLDDAEIPDNAGNQPDDQPISTYGPPAFWSTLPVKEIVAELRKEDIPASLSLSAGMFVCNHVFYRLMEFLQGKPRVKGGFVHIPPLAENTDSGLTYDLLSDGIRIALEIFVGNNPGKV